MGSATKVTPIEIIAYEGVVIFVGFGSQVILTAGEAERIACEFHAAAFAASTFKTEVIRDTRLSTEWRKTPKDRGAAIVDGAPARYRRVQSKVFDRP